MKMKLIKSGHSGEEKEVPTEDMTTGCCCWVFATTEAESAFADTDRLGLKQTIQDSCRITLRSNGVLLAWASILAICEPFCMPKDASGRNSQACASFK